MIFCCFFLYFFVYLQARTYNNEKSESYECHFASSDYRHSREGDDEF